MELEEIVEMLTVSSGDLLESVESVSGNGDSIVPANVYVINMLQEEKEDGEINVVDEITYSLWDKPLDEYSVIEGLLLIIVLILIVGAVGGIIKGGFKC